jgi:WD40 repeat protein
MDLFTVAPNRVYLVDGWKGGEVRDAFNGAQLVFGGFLTVEPISNDAEHVTDVSVAPDGRIFAVGYPDCCGPRNGYLWRFAPNGTRIGYGPVGGARTLNAVAVPDDTTLLVATNDYYGTVTLLACGLDGTFRATLWSVSVATSSNVDMAIAPSGDVYIADDYNGRILRYSRSGAPLGSWGNRGTGEGQFDLASGIAVDGAGNIYVSDFGNNRVQKFGPDGTFKVSWGGSAGTQPGPGLALFQPRAVACLGDYVLVGTIVPVEFDRRGTVVKAFQFSSPTPATRETWGSVKARYRSEGAAKQAQDK